MAQLVKALRYKPEGRGFDSRCDHFIYSFWPLYGPGVDSACNRNFLGLGTNGGRNIGLTTLLLTCADFLKFLGASSSRSHKGLHKGLLYISVLCACSYLYIEICAHNKHTNYTLLHLATRDTSVKATDNNPSKSKTPRLEFCIHTTKL